MFLRVYARPQAATSLDATFLRKLVYPCARVRSLMSSALSPRSVSPMPNYDPSALFLHEAGPLVPLLESCAQSRWQACRSIVWAGVRQEAQLRQPLLRSHLPRWSLRPLPGQGKVQMLLWQRRTRAGMWGRGRKGSLYFGRWPRTPLDWTFPMRELM